MIYCNQADGDSQLTFNREIKMKKGLNDTDRSQWIDNDEGLYNWFSRSRLSKKNFIKENNVELDACINKVLYGTKPAHYLAYGG